MFHCVFLLLPIIGHHVQLSSFLLSSSGLRGAKVPPLWMGNYRFIVENGNLTVKPVQRDQSVTVTCLAPAAWVGPQWLSAGTGSVTRGSLTEGCLQVMTRKK